MRYDKGSSSGKNNFYFIQEFSGKSLRWKGSHTHHRLSINYNR